MYTEAQVRIIAYELARHGGHVNKTVEALRNEYESFRKIGPSTLRREKEKKGFLDLYEHFRERIKQAAKDAELDKLEADARADIETSRGKDVEVLTIVQDRAKVVAKDLKPDQLARYHVGLKREIEKTRLAGRTRAADKRKAAPSGEEASIENL